MAQGSRRPSEDAAAARAEIERTRARMTKTIDDIEQNLVRKKQVVREQLDVGARIRAKPLQAAGIALGAGLVVGLLWGPRKRPSGGDADERAALWESRARRLLSVTRTLEEEIEDLESALKEYRRNGASRAARVGDGRATRRSSKARSEAASMWSQVATAVGERIGDVVTQASRQLMQNIRSRR